MISSKDNVILEEDVVVLKKPTARRRPSKSVTKHADEVVLIDVTPVAVLDAPEMITVVKKAKVIKAKKTKLVRDSFTIPELEYAQLAALKQRCLAAGVAVKKSELLRAGLQALALMPEAVLIGQLATLEKLKTGRPAHK
ncbi:hypothetical protein R6242_19190 [Iodobacter sp. CM08]|uniref:hypothetical protein n=1 Tax=Iodobacter sp. CM08 TaxID=3085902 RepID=UPI002981F443|nr:hypothetical protein [Iodobacter sp. CM08]MDW5418696.1 hypothetical protein [Iodobacter sp. CM08]